MAAGVALGSMKGTSWSATKDASIPIALVVTLVILIFPMPSWLLDVCIALNMTVSFMVLFAALYIERPLSFSAFPAILLLTTLFRLSLNIASTRLILLNGDQGTSAAGHVIQAFGQFVVGGNYAIGIIIFIVISLVNLKVITKGSGRIAEVAARFTLDAMPGKQMAIDSDLNTGIINETEAKRRRKEIQMEAEFYGSMDGSAKFVSGDAMAALFIVAINIAGGFFIGVVQHKMTFLNAASTYTILTIGEGLVSQIPSFIISTAAGIIVARAGSGGDLAGEVGGQLAESSRPLAITSGVLAGFAVVPGMPTIPFLVLAIAVGSLSYLKRGAVEKKKAEAELATKPETKEDPGKPKPGSREEVTQLLGMDVLELEVGYELVRLVEGGDLVERIRNIRRQFATDFGFVLPPIHIRDNVRIKPAEYRLVLKGAVVGNGELKSHYLLAMDPGNVANPVQGIPTKEPAFGLDAIWIQESDKERAQFSGYTVVDLSTVITTHITELLRVNMAELLGRQEVQYLLDNVQKESPKVIEELVPGIMSVGQIQQVLARLLREQISVRDLRTILETLADWGTSVKNPEKLAEFVRRKLSRTITAKFLSPEGTLTLTSLTPVLERLLSEAVQHTDEGSFLALEPGTAQQLITRLSRLAEKFVELGQTPLILAPAHLRPAMFHFVERFVPGYAVISHQEIASNTRVQSLGVVTIEGLQAPQGQ